MKRVLLIALTLSLSVGVAAAQQRECGNGLPCGSIPWPLANPPALTSPTPMPTVGVTAVLPTSTPGGPTATPIPPTAGFDIDTSGISDQFATLQAMAEATDEPVLVDGTPVSTNEQLTEIVDDSTTFFSYVRGIAEVDLGVGFSPIWGFIFLSFVVVLSVTIFTYILPVLSALFGLIRKIIGIVLDFLPL